jgi:hypothetical protein
MFNFANIDIHRIATAAVGALVLSTACVGAAVAPARAVETDATFQVGQAEGGAAGTLNA